MRFVHLIIGVILFIGLVLRLLGAVFTQDRQTEILHISWAILMAISLIALGLQ